MFKKTIIKIVEIVSVITVILIGLKYVQNNSSYLTSEDVKKAKETIKKSTKDIKDSKTIIVNTKQEVERVKQLSIIHRKQIDDINKEVVKLRTTTNIIKDRKKNRKLSFLTKE